MGKIKTYVHFVVPGDPIGKSRPRFTRKGRPYTPQKTKEYEKRIKKAFLDAGGKTACGNPVSVQVFCFYRVPKSVSKSKKKEMLSAKCLPTKRPDLDNVLKAVCDGLNGVAYNDDCQVVCLSGSKEYSNRPRIEVVFGYRGVGYSGDEIYKWDVDGFQKAGYKIIEEEANNKMRGIENEIF